MQITNMTCCLLNRQYISTPQFQGLKSKSAVRVAEICNLGELRDGYIGKIAFEKANGIKEFLSLEKQTSGKGKYETYFLKNNKKQLVGFLDITIHRVVDPILPKGVHYTSHVYVSNINNYSRPGEENHDSRLDEYKGVGTKFMQIALKRSEEAGCEGNIELHASTDFVKENFYKKIGLVEDLSDKYREFHENKMYLPSANKEILRQREGGLEIILPDNRVLLSK